MWYRPDPLEVKLDRATHDHYVFMQGYYAGRRDGREWTTWLYRGTGPCPCSMEADKASPYRRLCKWLEREWKRRK